MLHKMKLQENPFERIKMEQKQQNLDCMMKKDKAYKLAMKSNFQNYQNYKKNYQ